MHINIPLCIENFKRSVVNVLSGFSHIIEEAIEFSITSDESNNTAATIEIKLVSANTQIFEVLEKACKMMLS